jgi:hypothetical protein
MKKRYLILLFAISLVCFFSCKKSNTQAPLPLSHWTINGITDSSSTVSAANDMNFVCLTNDQQKSISIDFFSTVFQSHTYKVTDILQDNTECTITVNAGDSSIYKSTGKVGDSLYENFSNHIITLTFNNISVHLSSNIVLVSGVLTFQSVY